MSDELVADLLKLARFQRTVLARKAALEKSLHQFPISFINDVREHHVKFIERNAEMAVLGDEAIVFPGILAGHWIAIC